MPGFPVDGHNVILERKVMLYPHQTLPEHFIVVDYNQGNIPLVARNAWPSHSWNSKNVSKFV